MPLHLTSCVPVREPGFSASECLELARRIERGDLLVIPALAVQGYQEASSFTRSGVAPIVAALRAYADE